MPVRYYESNATSRSQGARVIRYNGYNDDGDPIFREATEVRKTYRKALRNLVKRGRVKLVYRKGSQRNAVSGLPYTPIRLDARYGYKKRTRLEKSYGFESWQLGETNVCGVSNVPSDCSATSMIGGMALDALKRLSRQARSQPFLLSVHFNAPVSLYSKLPFTAETLRFISLQCPGSRDSAASADGCISRVF
jgi:hypothetical protein